MGIRGNKSHLPWQEARELTRVARAFLRASVARERSQFHILHFFTELTRKGLVKELEGGLTKREFEELRGVWPELLGQRKNSEPILFQRDQRKNKP